MERVDDAVVVRTDMPALLDDGIVAIAEQAEKRIAAIKKIKEMALKVTGIYDWTDQGGKPYLQVSGSEKVGRLFGVSWRLSEPVKEDLGDGHFSYTFKGIFSLGAASIEVVGTRSSKDPFFSTRYEWKEGDGGQKVKTKIMLPATEVDSGNVKKGALTNCLGNGITRLLGIRNLTWEQVQSVTGFGKEDVSQIQYGRKPGGGTSGKKGKGEGDKGKATKTKAKKKLEALIKEANSVTRDDVKAAAGKKSMNDFTQFEMEAMTNNWDATKAKIVAWQEAQVQAATITEKEPGDEAARKLDPDNDENPKQSYPDGPPVSDTEPSYFDREFKGLRSNFEGKLKNHILYGKISEATPEDLKHLREKWADNKETMDKPFPIATPQPGIEGDPMVPVETETDPLKIPMICPDNSPTHDDVMTLAYCQKACNWPEKTTQCKPFMEAGEDVAF